MPAGRKTRSVFVPALVMMVCTILLALPGCRVVRDDQRAKMSASGEASFDAGKYVDGFWDSKALPFFQTKSVDLSTLAGALRSDLDAAGKQYGHRADAEGSPWSFPVKVKGTVESVNTQSRAGTFVIASGNEKVTVQIGPVVRGTAIRDSLPFFSFGDVTNQIQFAQVGRALNDHALAAIQPAAGSLAAGQTVEVLGAISLTAVPATIVVMPVSLKPVTGGTQP